MNRRDAAFLRRVLLQALAIILLILALSPTATVLAQARQDNLAWKKMVTATPGAKDLLGMNDGKYGTKADIPDKGSFTIDLGARETVGRVFFVFRGRPFSKGTLYSSDDGVNWTQLWQQCGWDPGCPMTFYGAELSMPPVTARYFKMQCSSPPESNQTSFYEFELYEPDSSSKNLALGKFAISHASANRQVPLMPNTRVTDGNLSSTIWLLNVAPWIVIDLEVPTLINRIKTISHIYGPSQEFSYYASDDNKTWRKLFDHQRGVSSQAFTSNVFDRVTARYVKGEYHDKPGELGAANIVEIEIYGPGASTVDIPSLPMNRPPSLAPGSSGGVDGAAAVSADAGASDAGAPDAGTPGVAMTVTTTADAASMSTGPGTPTSSPAEEAGVGPAPGPRTSSGSGCSVAPPGGSRVPPATMPLLLVGILLAARAMRSRRAAARMVAGAGLFALGMTLGCAGGTPGTDARAGSGGDPGSAGRGGAVSVLDASVVPDGADAAYTAPVSGGDAASAAGGDANASSARPDTASNLPRDSGSAADRPPAAVVPPDSVCKNGAPCTKDCSHCNRPGSTTPCRCFIDKGQTVGRLYCNYEIIVYQVCSSLPDASSDVR